MSENDRFLAMLDFLITTKKVRHQQQFTEETCIDKTTVSRIKNGKIKIPKIALVKIEKAYPDISADWLKTGNGEMLKSEPPKPATVENPTIERFLTLIESQQRVVESQQRTIENLTRKPN